MQLKVTFQGGKRRMKNTNAIEKIIAELSKRDYEARCKKLTKTKLIILDMERKHCQITVDIL